MHMPFARRIGKICVASSGKKQDPDRNCHSGKHCGTQKKRSESVGKERRSIVAGTLTRRGGHIILISGKLFVI